VQQPEWFGRVVDEMPPRVCNDFVFDASPVTFGREVDWLIRDLPLTTSETQRKIHCMSNNTWPRSMQMAPVARITVSMKGEITAGSGSSMEPPSIRINAY
jgi:hypothetical protein